MKRSELIGRLVETVEYLDDDRARQAVEAFFDEIACSLERGERVELRGFGSFFTRQYRERSGRNPRTGEQVHVPSKRAPLFRMGQSFQNQLIERSSGGVDKDQQAA